MIRVALLSYWHVHAKDYARMAQEHPATEIAAVWDEDRNRGREAAQQLNVPYRESLDDVLASPNIDGVIVTTPTVRHRDVMLASARAGKHIFTEKVLAPTLVEVQEILNAVEASSVKLTVSLPRLNFGFTHAIRRIVAKNWLGRLTLVRARLSHNGATTGWLPERFFNLSECGGGALIDLGCHPMYLTTTLLGIPESVSAHFGSITGKEAEDNAAVVLQYGNGALGIVEAGFVNSHSPFCIEVHGTEGTLLYGAPEKKLLLRSSKRTDGPAKEWREIEIPRDSENAFTQWIGHIQANTYATHNIQTAVDLTRLMEAAYRSAMEQRNVRLNELEEPGGMR